MTAQKDKQSVKKEMTVLSFYGQLPLRFSWFCFMSGLVSIQSCFKRSRSLSLCFLDLFFLCWPLVNCWSVQMDVLVCGPFELGAVGADSVLSSLGIVEDPLSLCGEYRQFGLPWRWLLVLSNSSLTCALEFPWLEELRAPLVVQSSWEGDCTGKHWSNSLCFLGVWQLDGSEGNGRFYGGKSRT